MPNDDNNLKAKVEILKREVTDVKSDIHEFQKMLALIDQTEGKVSDEKELKAVDRLLEDL